MGLVKLIINEYVKIILIKHTPILTLIKFSDTTIQQVVNTFDLF